MAEKTDGKRYQNGRNKKQTKTHTKGKGREGKVRQNGRDGKRKEGTGKGRKGTWK